MSRTKDGGRVFAVALSVAFALASVAYGLGHSVGRAAERRQAVEAGVARYVADPTTGETRFEYLGAKETRL